MLGDQESFRGFTVVSPLYWWVHIVWCIVVNKARLSPLFYVHGCQKGWAVFVSSPLCLEHGGQQGWAVLVGSPMCMVNGDQQDWAVLVGSLLCMVVNKVGLSL